MNQRPIFIDEAVQMILQHVCSAGAHLLNLPETEGHILAEDLYASTDVPHFSKSMMDGFAIRSEDVQDASFSSPVTLKVIDEVMAGEVSSCRLQPGEAIRIMTGAPIPAGADAVCRFEQTRDGFKQNIREVAILTPVRAGESISFCGEDIQKGQLLLSEGSQIGPSEASILATFGIADVPVFKKPRVGIVSTGSELVDYRSTAEEVSDGKLRNSNSILVSQLIQQHGGIPRIYPYVSDDPEALQERLRSMLEREDIVVFTGGVSVGDKDYIPHICRETGVDIKFWKVMIRPGQPAMFGVFGKRLVFGLSGNPAACFINALLFLVPAIRAMNGRKGDQVTLPALTARLIGDVGQKPVKHTRFLRGNVFLDEGQLFVDIQRAQSSAIMSSFLGTNCLVRIDSDHIPKHGELVSIYQYGLIGKPV
ncbi:molybdopterin molybdotransferase MoeA [Fodinisporobacter ferrooxydans]|uniref:Molybdopterin molybdenumtransferase n=1 Tax=Fodinisporobacter ferrooxydans TaxID=2901836 RepID=A0ABY4CQ33_9BACL|nr:molybdopterin molybdotransferase MoeA [Alicyclobacillaceae bacterium MYW30-H2]